ncbi:MAG: hypothetical protein K0T01_2894 [Acidimicrobiia bacterium]|nr:hypothetical protein [Acidimicrobiia bacterium]
MSGDTMSAIVLMVASIGAGLYTAMSSVTAQAESAELASTVTS